MSKVYNCSNLSCSFNNFICFETNYCKYGNIIYSSTYISSIICTYGSAKLCLVCVNYEFQYDNAYVINHTRVIFYEFSVYSSDSLNSALFFSWLPTYLFRMNNSTPIVPSILQHRDAYYVRVEFPYLVLQKTHNPTIEAKNDY